MRDELDLIAACLALRAANVGGPLSLAEVRLASRASRQRPVPKRKMLDELRQAVNRGEDPLGEAFCRLRLGERRRRNSELNSVKRLLREVGGKAGGWRRQFGQQVVTAAVLRGVYRPDNVMDAQEDHGVAVFWEHNLGPLETFLRKAAPE